MNTKASLVLILALVLLGGVALVAVSRAAPGYAPLAHPAQGGAPTVVAYQGEVRVGSAPYTGTGYLKFAIVNVAGDTTYWSNDGTGTGGGEPTAAVELAVSEGLFSVLLGDSGMQALTADVFSQPDRYLRVWFSTSDSGPFSQLTPDTRIAAVPYALQAERVRGYAGVVSVAKSGGDYTSVQAAIDSITGAAADNPYLVWVAPGVYSETVVLKPYVHLQGAGQEATIITSTVSSDWSPIQATMLMTHHVSLHDLTVGNSGVLTMNVALLAMDGTTQTLVADVTARAQGGGQYAFGIYLTGSGIGVMLQDVTGLAENGTMNRGLANVAEAAATLHGGTFVGRGGNAAYGIQNSSSAVLKARDVTALGENSSNLNYGLYNGYGATATLRGGTFTGREGSVSWGIYNGSPGDTTLEAENVFALAENGDNYNYGIDNERVAMLYGGVFTARGGSNAYGIYNEGGGARLKAEGIVALAEGGIANNYGLYNYATAQAWLAVTQLNGGVASPSSSLTCFQVYDGNYNAVTCP